MENKLQELTDRLYKEGLSKGKEEGEAILAKANEKAEEILSAARKEAQSILDAAQKEAKDFKTKVEGDVKMAAAQSLQATKKDIEDLMLHKMVDAPVAASLADAESLAMTASAPSKAEQMRPLPTTCSPPRESTVARILS